MLSAIGDQAIIVVTAFVALGLLGDASGYGLFYALAYIAPFLLAVTGGALADRRVWAKRSSVVGLVVRGVSNLVVGIMLLGGIQDSPSLALLVLGLFQVVHSGVGALTDPAMLPTLRLVADGDDEWFDRALVTATVQRNLARLAGPLIGGLLLAFGQGAYAYLLNSLSFFAIAAPLAYCLRRMADGAARTGPAPSAEVTGYRGLWRHAPDFLAFQCVAFLSTVLLVQPYLILGRVAIQDGSASDASLSWAVISGSFAAGGILGPVISRSDRYRASVPRRSPYAYATALGVANAVLLIEIVHLHDLRLLVPTAFAAGLAQALANVSVLRAVGDRVPGSLGAASALGNLAWSSSVLVAGVLVSIASRTAQVPELGTHLAVTGLIVTALGLLVLPRVHATRDPGDSSPPPAPRVDP
jgi:hypothetical protein